MSKTALIDIKNKFQEIKKDQKMDLRKQEKVHNYWIFSVCAFCVFRFVFNIQAQG